MKAPILACLLPLLMFGLLIGKHETHLKNGTLMYVKLAPSDPRSLMQGDYMELRYKLGIADMELPEPLHDQYKLHATVVLDDRHVIQRTDPYGKDAGYALRLTNRHGYVDEIYPAAASFMFAEGLASCYENAQYAKLSVLPNGQSLLVELMGERLESLDCEKGRSWADGFDAFGLETDGEERGAVRYQKIASWQDW